MASVTCDWGDTQITRVLEHALGEARSQKIGAVVFVGDSVEEGTWSLYYLAEELGKAGVPLFLFQEDDDASVEKTFRKMAELSGGAYARFDRSSADRLKSLLGAVAAYATGGRRALESYTNKQGGEVRLLTAQLRR